MNGLPFIDGVNLAFHEGGHIIFRILGIEFLTVLGGTLMQLAIPMAAAFHFEAREMRISACIVWIWFGENFLPIGRYMQDAMVQQLPLVGDGTHDWTYLFGAVGVLPHCVGIGSCVILGGWIIMALSGFRLIKEINARKNTGASKTL